MNDIDKNELFAAADEASRTLSSIDDSIISGFRHLAEQFSDLAAAARASRTRYDLEIHDAVPSEAALDLAAIASRIYCTELAAWVGTSGSSPDSTWAQRQLVAAVVSAHELWRLCECTQEDLVKQMDAAWQPSASVP